MHGKCPSCGYCPCCGRQDVSPAYPYWQPYIPPQYPYWQGGGTVQVTPNPDVTTVTIKQPDNLVFTVSNT